MSPASLIESRDVKAAPHRRMVAATADVRARAFKAARRNTLMVRTLRLALPCCAAILLGIYALQFMQTMTFSIGGGEEKVAFRVAEMSRDNLKMANPRYEGFGDDGSEYVVTAAWAKIATKPGQPIDLETITGHVRQGDERITRFAATRGTFDQATAKLKLRDGIQIDGDDGLAARLVDAVIDQKTGLVASEKPVDVRLASGSVVGQAMRFDQRKGLLTFHGGVRAEVKPAAERSDAAVDASRASGALQSAGLAIGAPGAPIIITSATLDVRQDAQTATFASNVAAVQGRARLDAERLIVNYQASRGEGARSSVPASPLTGSGALKSIEARDNVTVTQDADTIAAAAFAFDAQSQIGRFSGGVTITSGDDRRAVAQEVTFNESAGDIQLIEGVEIAQGPNRLRGEKLTVARADGVMVLEGSSVRGRQPRISATFASNSGPAGAPRGKEPGKPAAAQKGDASVIGGWSFRADTKAPIEIAADRLRVDDRRKTAVFTGSVKAAQGAFHLASNRVTAVYVGSTSLMSGGAGNGPQAPGPAGSLKTLRAEGGVVVTSDNGQQAKGDVAVFDVPRNEVVITGNMVLTQGRQTVRGERLVIDMDTGLVRIVAPDGIAAAGGGDGARSRMRATFFPSDMQNTRSPGGSGAASGWAPVGGDARN